MTVKGITVERVLEIIEAYGAYPNGWPEEERLSAEAMIGAQQDTFAAALADARELDRILAEGAIVEPSADLAARILASAPETPRLGMIARLKDILFPQGTRWPAGATLASLAMGLIGGYAYASTGIVYDEAGEAYYSAFSYDAETAWVSEDAE